MLTLRLLGEFEVLRDGERVNLPIFYLSEGAVGGILLKPREGDPVPVAVTSAVLRGEDDAVAGAAHGHLLAGAEGTVAGDLHVHIEG
mgnify:CR=1 FL=1